MAPVTDAEVFELQQCERQIDIHMRSWIETGKALENIRRKRLYRRDFKTFEAYCKQRWKLSRRQTDRLINAAHAAQNLGILSPIGLVSEGAIRPLTALAADEQRAAWSLAIEAAPRDADGTPKITAKLVAAAVHKITQADATDAPQTPSNVIRLRRTATITIAPGKPEQAVQKLLADADERDVMEFYSELGWTLHRLGKITGWIEVIRAWEDEKKEAACS